MINFKGTLKNPQKYNEKSLNEKATLENHSLSAKGERGTKKDVRHIEIELQ